MKADQNTNMAEIKREGIAFPEEIEEMRAWREKFQAETKAIQAETEAIKEKRNLCGIIRWKPI
jgi:hypothetical protein